jgi:N utilization substance protein B
VQGEKARPLVEDFLADSQDPPETVSAARAMLQAAWTDRAACDGLLVRHARNWELTRLALVDRNILRLGVCELRAAQTPPKVVITEALKLAQEFSTADSPRFVNGVLDAVAKEISRDTGDAGDRKREIEKEEVREEKEEEDKEK